MVEEVDNSVSKLNSLKEKWQKEKAKEIFADIESNYIRSRILCTRKFQKYIHIIYRDYKKLKQKHGGGN